MAEKIRIVLSTFNGSRFIGQQIKSIQEQSISNWELLVRDDGSTDGTQALLKEFASLDSRIKVVEGEAKNLGPTQSFAYLMKVASDSDYLFFCDQDDFWLPSKIAMSLKAIKEIESSESTTIPIAVHSDLSICDENLNIVVHSMKKDSRAKSAPNINLFMPLLAQNFVTGCTLGVNQALLKASLPIANEALMHDWWIALIASALGKIAFIPEALVKYRQHGKNASGTAHKRGIVAGTKKFLAHMHEFDSLMKRRFQQSMALEKHLSLFAPNAALFALQNFHKSVRSGRFSAIRNGFNSGLSLESPARSLAYYILLAKNGPDLLKTI